MTFTAASPAKPAPTAIEVAVSLDVAPTATLPVVETFARLAMEASVSLVTTSTSIPAPTPAVPPMATAPAMLRIVVVSLAVTDAAALGASPMTADGSICALVVSLITLTTTEPATPAESPPAPLTAISSRFSV